MVVALYVSVSLSSSTLSNNNDTGYNVHLQSGCSTGASDVFPDGFCGESIVEMTRIVIVTDVHIVYYKPQRILPLRLTVSYTS